MTQSSYLMAFIRSLMKNTSKDVREEKKRKLESDFTDTGVVLNSCLTEKFEDVTKVLNVYNSVSERVSANIAAVGKVKRDLVECKSLLYCNREELQRLWLELVEQRRCIELLDMLDRLQAAPDAINTLVATRAWPEATDLMLYAFELLKTDIAEVPAVQSLNTELAQKHRFIVDNLKKRLRILLYERPITFVLEKYLKRNDLRKPDTRTNAAFNKAASEAFPTPVNTQPLSVEHFNALPLADWHTANVQAPTADQSLRKDPRSVAVAIAAHKTSQRQSNNNTTSTNTTTTTTTEPVKSATEWTELEWVRELVDVVHCISRLDRLPQILISWCPQSSMAQLHQAMNMSNRNMFSGPLRPGQGLLGQLHRYIVLRAVSAVEAKAVSQGDTGLLSSLHAPQYLVLLFRIIFDALFIQARACLLVIRTMKASQLSAQKPSADLEGLSEEYVWFCLQHEIQLILSMHLNKQPGDENTTDPTSSSGIAHLATSAVDLGKLDLNALLGRKRGAPFSLASASGAIGAGGMAAIAGAAFSTGSTMGTSSSGTDGKPASLELFFFENTSHFLSVSSYMRENRMFMDFGENTLQRNDTTADCAAYPLVCRPNQNNITSVHGQTLQFVYAVDHEWELCKSENNSPTSVLRMSQLRLYLKNFIQSTYLPEALTSLRLKLQRSLSDRESLSTVVSQSIERKLGLHRPILQNTYSMDQCLLEVKKLIIAMPEYADGCLKIGTALINEFIGVMWRVYRTLGEVDSSGTTVPSSDWSKDNDVGRFWKKFPVWQRMAAHETRLSSSNALLSSHKDHTDGTEATAEALANTHISPATAVVLGLYAGNEGETSMGDSQWHARLVIPFVNQPTPDTGSAGDERHVDYSHLSGLLREREATQLAAKETEQLLHMIKDELPDSTDQPQKPAATTTMLQSRTRSAKKQSHLVQLPTVRNPQLLKILGRLNESLSWLSQRVLQLDTWMQQQRPRSVQASSTGSSDRRGTGDARRSNQSGLHRFVDTPFASCSKELTRLSEACLLMTYLEVRIQAYNHFGGLPGAVTYWCPVDDVDVDQFVTDFLVYLEQVQDMLMNTFSRHKFLFIFDGLGDFISQLLLRLIPMVSRMNTNGNRKMCRNVYRLQQALASLTETHESDLIRVKQLFELFYLTPEAVVNRLMEQGVAFEEKVYRNLLELYQRSHPTHPYAKTEESIAKLSIVIRRSMA